MPAHPSVQEMAERVFAEKTGRLTSVDDAVAALENAYERLEFVLTSVLGDVGYRAIFVRTLRKIRVAYPCLEGVTTIESEAFLELLLESSAATRPWHDPRGEHRPFLTHLVELLWTLIGAELTLKLLRRAWPEDVTNALNLLEK